MGSTTSRRTEFIPFLPATASRNGINSVLRIGCQLQIPHLRIITNPVPHPRNAVAFGFGSNKSSAEVLKSSTDFRLIGLTCPCDGNGRQLVH